MNRKAKMSKKNRIKNLQIQYKNTNFQFLFFLLKKKKKYFILHFENIEKKLEHSKKRIRPQKIIISKHFFRIPKTL